MNPNLLTTEAGKQWGRIGVRHHHGINLPLFSLVSEKSAGIGEFTDLIPLIDWCQEVGFTVIQTLPLNDNGHNASPYSALSAFALNPLHLGLATLPLLEEHPDLIEKLTPLRALNKTHRIDYIRVHAMRDQWLRAYFKRVGGDILASVGFRKFTEEHPWLRSYALFKSLKIYSMWQDWRMWSEDLQTPTQHQFESLCQEFQEEIAYHECMQYFCFLQMESVKLHADKKRVFLKGDIPILINRESADVWHNRKLFQLDYSAGAPPDMFTPEGQNWGFPIYNWETMTKQGHHWWKLRLEVASKLYHLYRLDHIVGFFRIWVVPPHLTGREGWFIPEDTSLWIDQGKELLQMMLKSCPMLPIGEDLGIVPDEVHACMERLGIVGTKVPRWQRNWDTDQMFIDPTSYRKSSMTTVSTHDSETLQQWWENNSADAAIYAENKGWSPSNVLTMEKRWEILRESHTSGSLFHINLLQEYLALVPGMSWPNPEDERINIPGTVTCQNWAYRFRPQLEEILHSATLSKEIKGLLKGV